MASKTLLIDGNSLIHRAYHALPHHLSTPSGQPTNAAFGFVQMLLLLLESEQPDVAILALDTPGPTFRHELDESYKANRPPMDEALASQLGIIHELAEAMGLVICELPGFEADDIIGTLARLAVEKDGEALIVSGDRDLLQLVGPCATVLATIKGIKQTKSYDSDAVREEFGVDPGAIADLKGLAGDSSDNIPGVPKVGPKTAQQLLGQFDSVEDLYERLDELENEKLRLRLGEHEESARLSKRLATIDTQAPVEEGLVDRRWEGLAATRLRKLLVDLDFTSLLGRVPADDVSGAELRIAEGPEALEELCAQARHAEALGVSVAVEDERPVGVAIAVADGSVGYFALPEPGVDEGLFAGREEVEVPDAPAALLADGDVRKVGHDLKRAARLLRPVGLELNGIAFDTAVAAYLVAPHRPDPGIDAMLAQHLGDALPAPDAADEGGPAGHAIHAGAEAAAALRLREPLQAELDAVGARELFESIEMPLTTILRDMEFAGIAVDVERLGEIGDKLSGMALDLASRAHKSVGEEFNLDSPKQVGEVLFGKLGLPKGRRTKTGWSTNAAVLEELAVDHEIAALILQYREYAKLKSTYADGLTRLVSREDGRIHTTFEQTVVATGRLSSRNPNLQNIPIRTELGREIRACFVAQSEGSVLLSADYSQIELRILAHMSGDAGLLEAFGAGEDIHRRTAAAIFDSDIGDVTSDMRRVAKTVNYAVIYGMGATALARQLGVKRAEAKEFIESYFRRLPGVKEYMDGVVEHARADGYVSTLFGRRRPLPELQAGVGRERAFAERAAANAPLQGTAADIIKIAMVRLVEQLPEVAPECRMLLQVHDELVFELPASDAAAVASLVREVMEGAAELDAPLVVEPKAGANWRDMEYL